MRNVLESSVNYIHHVARTSNLKHTIRFNCISHLFLLNKKSMIEDDYFYIFLS